MKTVRHRLNLQKKKNVTPICVWLGRLHHGQSVQQHVVKEFNNETSLAPKKDCVIQMNGQLTSSCVMLDHVCSGQLNHGASVRSRVAAGFRRELYSA
jgi:hypothetical protein